MGGRFWGGARGGQPGGRHVKYWVRKTLSQLGKAPGTCRPGSEWSWRIVGKRYSRTPTKGGVIAPPRRVRGIPQHITPPNPPNARSSCSLPLTTSRFFVAHPPSPTAQLAPPLPVWDRQVPTLSRDKGSRIFRNTSDSGITLPTMSAWMDQWISLYFLCRCLFWLLFLYFPLSHFSLLSGRNIYFFLALKNWSNMIHESAAPMRFRLCYHLLTARQLSQREPCTGSAQDKATFSSTKQYNTRVLESYENIANSLSKPRIPGMIVQNAESLAE